MEKNIWAVNKKTISNTIPKPLRIRKKYNKSTNNMKTDR